MKTIDIYSKGDYPASVLSNFHPNEFCIDGVRCGSMEGFLQSLKFRSEKKQREIAALKGREAKWAARRKFFWRLTGRVRWQGRSIKRTGAEFSSLVLRAYALMYEQSASFRGALDSTVGVTLTHSIGKHSKQKTILTEEEFIYALTVTRALNQSKT